MNSEVLVKFKGDTKDLDNATKNAEKATNGLKNAFVPGLKGAAGIMAGAMATATAAILAVGSAMIKITKQSVELYGEYEQLVGGVETLFGTGGQSIEEYAKKTGKSVKQVEKEYQALEESQKLVMKNAQEAYKTAGVSANEYMEGVNSFAASLLQSTSGNTQKAAEAADKAFRDMSDNANKMGTSMQSIQNAYQGFAKQNYTMLDNLKLGYGGTKSEMERLLADATKLSGVKYDISNLADVYEAIHVIQEEMGITGTTSKEAASTIQGSAKTMKAAWKNLLTGFGDSNADINALIDNLVNSVITFGDNIMPVIERVLTAVIDALPKLLTKLIEYLPRFLEMGAQLLNKLIEGISTNIQPIIQAVMQIIRTISNALINNLPQILKLGLEIILELAKGIAESLPELIPAIVEVVLEMVQTLIDNIDLLIDAAIALMIGLTEGLINAIPILIEKTPEIVWALFNALLRAAPKLLVAGLELIATIVSGLVNNVFRVIDWALDLPEKIKNAILDGLNKLKDAGKDCMEGLVNGMKDKWNNLKGSVENLGGKIVDKFKNVFGIHSPSTVMKQQIGVNLGLGLIEGLDATQREIQRHVGTLSTDINEGLRVSAGDFNTDISPQLTGTAMTHMSPQVNVVVNNDINQDPLGQMVSQIKTFAGGAKNDFNYGMGNN